MKNKKMISRIFITIFMISIMILGYNAVFAQDEKAEEPTSTEASAEIIAEENIKFVADWSRFRYADSLTYLEYYLAIPRNVLSFVPDSVVGYAAIFEVTATLMQDDSTISTKIWRNRTKVDSLEAIDGTQRLFAVNHFAVDEGEYVLSLSLKDVNSGKSKEHEGPVVIEEYISDKLTISDMQLSTNIVKNDEKSSLKKNGFWIYPNPTRLYGIGLPILYSYAEIYNLAPATTDSGKQYVVQYRVFDTDGVQVKEFNPKVKTKPGGSAVEVNGVNVVTLVSGPYFVEMEVEDKETGEKKVTRQKFFVYREGDYAEGGAAFKKQEQMAGIGSPGLDAGRYDEMDEKSLDQELEWCRYISTKDERNTFKTLTLDGKRNFIKEFWAKRDQTPTTPVNEFKRRYLAMVEYANQAYRGSFRDGWRTDRGRVGLVYGKADEIERFPFSNQNKSYEVWHFFSLQGGIDFVFVDRRDMGDYELVHSTARGELYDPQWTRWINPTGSGSYSSEY
jgi:GWxTD domain-containing protein